MGIVPVGQPPLTKSLMAGYPIKTRDESGKWSLEYLWKVDKSLAKQQAPSHGDAAPETDPDFSGLLCSRVEIRPDGASGIQSTIRAMFVAPTSGHAHFPSEVIRTSSAAIVERPIEEHPDGATIAAGKKANGRATFFAGSLIYRRRYTDNSFSWTQADLINTVGKRAAPTGVGTPTANAWLKTEFNVDESTGEIEEAWQYDAGLWDTDIYDT